MDARSEARSQGFGVPATTGAGEHPQRSGHGTGGRRLHAVRSALVGARCAACGATGVSFCGACLAGVQPPPASGEVVTWAAYDGAVRRALRAAKFEGATAWWRDAAVGLAGALDAAGVLAQRPVLVPFPTPWARRRQRRGIDHTARLVAALAAETGCARRRLLVPAGLSAAASVVPQHRRGLDGRQERVGPRVLVADAAVAVDGLVVVVDDVVTTGATIASALRALRAAGIPSCGASVAATPRRRQGSIDLVPHHPDASAPGRTAAG